MKSLIILAACAVLSGCSSLITAVNGYGAVAVDDARAANDTVIKGWKVAACATPYSAIQRNPDIKPAIKALCGEL